MVAKRPKKMRLQHVVNALNAIAPPSFAQSWDNVGLLAGRLNAPCKSALLCIDMMPAVVDEAIAKRADLVIAYHPPLFRPVKRLVSPTSGMEDGVYRCIEKGIAVYSPHTALDVAVGGTNDVLSKHCGVADPKPLEREVGPSKSSKVVAFVPANEVERVSQAMSDAGAGVIGNYDQCSFQMNGAGTFRGGADSQPTIGKRGQRETVAEVRLEMMCPNRALTRVIDALRAAHSYEEPAFDVYPLTQVAQDGIGRVGALAKGTTLKKLAQRLKRRTGARCVSVVGALETPLTRAIVGVGAAGSMPFALNPAAGDVVVTGEMRHHDALTLLRSGACAVVLSHWSSERPALTALAQLLTQRLAGFETTLSDTDAEPFIRV